MDNAARTRQRVLAVFLPVTAVLYISAEALSPKGTDPRPGITRSRSGPASPPAQSCASWNRSRAVPRAGRRATVLPGLGATAWGYCP